jgi:hypothetical protein
MIPCVHVDRTEFLRALKILDKSLKSKRYPEAIIAFKEGMLSIDIPGMGTTVPAEGVWSGQALAPSILIRALATKLPAGDPLSLRVEGGKIHIGSLSVPCSWQPAEPNVPTVAKKTGESDMPGSHFGFPYSQWTKAKEEVHKLLIAYACSQWEITYDEIVTKVRTLPFKKYQPILLTMLQEISTEEDAAGHGILSTVVVHKRGEARPGPGFFELAQRLGRNTSDIEKCWAEERKKVYEVWKSQPRNESTQTASGTKISQGRIADRLKELKSLFDDSLITSEEYDRKRKEILAEL